MRLKPAGRIALGFTRPGLGRERLNVTNGLSDRMAAKREVRRIKNLPTVPGIVAKISRMVENPETSAAEVGRLITQDQVLSAKVPPPSLIHH